jgi:hypothetical protein
MARPEEPAQAGKGYPLRQRPQTFYERLMPCTQFEALDRHRQAWCDRGIDSDEETVRDKIDKTKDKDEDEDDSQEEPAPLEARIRTTIVDMFKRVLLFSQGAAEAFYDDQMVTTLDVLQDLTDNIIKELCHAIRKPGGGRTWSSNLQAFRDPPQAVCILGKAHVVDFKRCR